MAKTASDLEEQINVLAEQLKNTAQMEVRRDIADHFLDMIKKPEDLRGYLRNEDVPLSSGNGVIKYRSYLPQVDADEFEFTQDFLLGIKLVCAALKDKNLDF